MSVYRKGMKIEETVIDRKEFDPTVTTVGEV